MIWKYENLSLYEIWITVFSITWVPRQLSIMWVSSLAANMGKREHSTWDITAKAKPEEGEEKEPIWSEIN